MSDNNVVDSKEPEDCAVIYDDGSRVVGITETEAIKKAEDGGIAVRMNGGGPLK